MVSCKSPEEIEIMKKGGTILSNVLDRVLQEAKAGIKLNHLDQFTEQLILSYGGEPSFKKVKGYNWSICTCLNDVVVHGIPSDYILRKGDILGIDCGVYFCGFHTDCAWSIQVGVKDKESKNSEIQQFLQTGEETLILAIREVKPDNYTYDISNTIQQNIEKAGYSVVRSLVGHGVGKKLHEEPEIPCFISSKREETVKIHQGMVFAIEVIYNMGGNEVMYKGNDGWTIATKDGKISGLFEVTVAVTAHGSLVLTPVQSLRNKLKEN